MKLKVGYKWKSIEGMSKGQTFCLIDVGPDKVVYKSTTTGRLYTAPRKHFEKYLERVHEYWSGTNKAYKNKKNQMKGE